MGLTDVSKKLRERRVMIYRTANLNDAPNVAILFRDLAFHIKNSSKDVYWDFEEMPLDMTDQVIRQYIENEESCILVAEEKDEIVGMMILELIPCHMVLSSHQKVGYIAAAYVKEAYRRQGIMKELEKLSNEFFKGLSIKYVEVCYLPENKGAKEAWNGMGYHCFREQARKCIE